MNGVEFLDILDFVVVLMNQLFDLMDGIEIISTAPALTLYGLAVFTMFGIMTADFINNIRSGN